MTIEQIEHAISAGLELLVAELIGRGGASETEICKAIADFGKCFAETLENFAQGRE